MLDGDIVIVGGGPAGSTTAIALARSAPELAARTVIVEKEIYPREKFCAGAIGRRGWALLERLDAVPDVPKVPVDGFSIRARSGERTARPGNLGSVVRRIQFDHAMIGIAQRAGVRLMEGTRVTGVRVDGPQAMVETTAGRLRAAVVVGCDGVGSIVRRCVGTRPETYRAQVLEVDTEAVSTDAERGILRFDVQDTGLVGYCWDFPTLVDGRPLMCRGVYRLRTGSEGTGSHRDSQQEPSPVDLTSYLGQRLASMGLDIAKCKRKQFSERGFESAETLVAGPVMLAGEAAGIDPITGEGIPQAIEYGVCAGEFLAQVFRGSRPFSDWEGVVWKSRLAFDLRFRHFLVKIAFGQMRPDAERWLLECPNLLESGCRHFAAMPVDWPGLAETILHGFWRFLSGTVQRSLIES